MKRKLLFAIAALLTSVGMWAQETPTNGSAYYIYNADNDLFFTRGADWGTQAYASPVGLPWRVEISDEKLTLRMYDIYTQNDADKGLGFNGSYVDNNSPIALTLSGNASNGFTLENGGNYISCPSSKGVVTMTSTASTWKFLTQAQYDAVLASRASAQDTDVATTKGFVIPEGKSLNAIVSNTSDWTSTKTDDALPTKATWPKTGGTQRNNNYNEGTYGIELFQSNDAYISKTITDLNPGIYKVSIRGMRRDGTNSCCAAMKTAGFHPSDVYMEANGNIIPFKAWADDNTADDNPDSPAQVVSIIEGSGFTNDGFVYVGDDGDLSLKIYTDAFWWGCWFVFNGVSYTQYTPKSLSDAAASFTSGNSATADTWYKFTVEEGTYQITSSNAATIKYSQDGTKTTIAEIDDAETFNAGQGKLITLSAGTLYFNSSATSTVTIAKLANGLNVTSTFITNPSFEDNNSDGWTFSRSPIGNSVKGDNNLTNKVGTYYQQVSNNYTAWNVRQTLSSIPVGKYILSINAKTDNAVTSFSLKMGSNSTTMGKQTAAATYYVAYEAEETADVQIGFDTNAAGGSGNNSYWRYDNFTLTYYTTLPDVSGVDDLLAEPMAGDVRAALDAANTAYTGDKTVANYNALQTAIVNAKVSIAEFAAKTGADADWTGVIQNPSFETGNTTGWTYTSSNDHGAKANDNATYTMSDVDGSYLFNIWATGNTISQTLKNLPAGSYKLTAVMGTDAGATFRLKMGDETGYATSVNKGTGVTVTVYAKLTAKGDLTISADAGGSMWYKVDNFQLTYSPTLPASLTAVEGKMNSSVESTQTSTVAAYNATSGQTIDNMIAAQAAIYAAHQSVQVYNSIATIKDGYDTKADALDATGQAAYATATGTASTGAETKYTEGTYTTAAEAETAYRRDYVAAVKAQDTDNADMTDVIVNPSFETKDNTGWSWSADSGNSNWDDASKFTSGSLADGGGLWFRDFWAQGANGKVYQTINLPAGSYELSVYTKTSEGTSINLKAGSETTTTTAENGEAFKMEVEFTLASQQNVEISIGSAAAGAWYNIDDFRLTLLASYYANAADYAALSGAISTASTTYSNHLGFEEGEYAPYNNIDALTALATAQAIDPKESNTKASVQTVTSALTGATWTDNDGDVECVYNGDFAIGQGSPAADIQNYGWSRTNGWGQFRNDVYGSTTGYYNQPGSLQYGNVGEYTMPLKANTIYRLQFKYGSWDHLTTPTISVLNATDGMAAQSFASTNTNYKNALTSVDMLFATGAAGNYILTLAGSDNIVFTGVSITKASSQTLTLPSATEYAAGTYPAVELDGRTFSDADRWYTLCVPFEFDKSLFSEVKELTGITVNGDNVSMTFGDAASTTTAGQPYLVKSSNSTITFEDVALDPSTTADNTSATADGYTVNYVGTFSNVALTSSNTDAWVVSNNMLYNVDSDVTVGVYRAYFTVTAPTPSPIKSLTIDGDATSVNAIDNGQLTMDNAAIYNLAGQKVKKATKGIYIINGKKTLVK